MPDQTKQRKNNPSFGAAALLLLSLALLFLVSCADGPQQAPTAPSPVASPTAVVAQETTPPDPTEPPPTSTPLPAASPDPATLEDVKGAYRLIVVTQLLADSLNQAALDAQSGAQDPLATNAQLVLAGVISTGITGARSDLSPPEPLAAYADQAQDINLSLDALTTAWRDRERTPDEVITALEPLMIDLAQLTRSAELALTAQWQMDPAAISQLRQDIIAEVTQILTDLATDLQSPAPTTPPTT